MQEQTTMSTQPTSSQIVTSTITTSLAGALNMLAVVLLCFIVMPRLNDINAEIMEGRKAVDRIQTTLDANQKELEEHRKVIKRLNDALDAAAAKAKALEKKKQ